MHVFPADSAVVQWYHNATLIDASIETGYSTSTSQDGSRHRLEIDSVGESELGEYVIVVSIDGANATDEIILKFHGEYILPFYCHSSYVIYHHFIIII